VPVPIKGRLTYPAPDWTERMTDGGVVFVDECGSVPPALQAPLLGLISARRIGSHQLGPRVRVIGAMNSSEISANGHDLSPPLANRFGHLKWGAPSVDQHAAYMLGQSEITAPQDAVAEENRVMREWPDAWAMAIGLEVAFLQAQPQMKNSKVVAYDPAASKAFASDRTWEYATRALAASEVHGLGLAARDEYVAAFIGQSTYEHFAAFIEAADLPRPADVLDGKVLFKWEPKRLDRSSAIVTACAALIVPEDAKQRRERAAMLWEIIGNATHYDITVPAAQAMVHAKLHVGMDAMPVLAKLEPVLRAAGIKQGHQL